MGPIWAITRLGFKEITRKKDFYIVFILLVVILFYTAQIRIYDVTSIVRYMREIALALIFLFSAILTIPLAARQIASEKSQRTLGVLMAKPLTRGQLVAGKFLSAYLAGSLSFLCFYLVFFVTVLLSPNPVGFKILFQTGYLYLLSLGVLAAMVSCFSYFMSFGANLTSAFLVYFVMMFYGQKLDLFAEKAGFIPRLFGQGLYYLLPHFEFFDIRIRLIHEWGPLPWDLMIILSLYAILMSSLFLCLGWCRFRKQVI